MARTGGGPRTNQAPSNPTSPVVATPSTTHPRTTPLRPTRPRRPTRRRLWYRAPLHQRILARFVYTYDAEQVHAVAQYIRRNDRARRFLQELRRLRRYDPESADPYPGFEGFERISEHSTPNGILRRYLTLGRHPDTGEFTLYLIGAEVTTESVRAHTRPDDLVAYQRLVPSDDDQEPISN